MKETVLVAIFLIHASAFAYFYFRRGRKPYNALFFSGFIFLAGYYAYESWRHFQDVESAASYVHYFRWVGLGLCALATPFFVRHLYRKRRSESDDPADPSENSASKAVYLKLRTVKGEDADFRESK
jgi:hypothetical protein